MAVLAKWDLTVIPRLREELLGMGSGAVPNSPTTCEQNQEGTTKKERWSAAEGTVRLTRQAAADSGHSMAESLEAELRRRREYDVDLDDGRLLRVE